MLNHVHHFRLGFRDVSFCDSEIQVVFFQVPNREGLSHGGHLAQDGT